jgi:hypothetical protein
LFADSVVGVQVTMKILYTIPWASAIPPTTAESYYFQPPTAGVEEPQVDEPTEGYRIPTICCCPNPATSHLRKQVNDQQLQQGWQSLKLYNIFGGVEATLTADLQRVVGQQPWHSAMNLIRMSRIYQTVSTSLP